MAPAGGFEDRRRHRGAPAEPQPLPQPAAQLTAADVTALQRTAGNQAVQRLLAPATPVLQRKGGDHPLAEALEMRTAAAKAALGQQEFATLAGWRLADLNILLGSPSSVQWMRQLAANFIGQTADTIRNLMARLAPRLGAATVVGLNPAEAAVLDPYANDAVAAHGILVATGRDVPRTRAALQLLAPYLANPGDLAVARQALANAGWDAAQAAPVVAYLMPYARDPVALAAARQELNTAAGDVNAAQAEMTVLARYHFDRALRAKADVRAQAVAEAEFQGAAAQAATAKQQRYGAADVAAEAAKATVKLPPEPPKKQKTKQAQEKARKYETAVAQAEGLAEQTRTSGREEAERLEQEELAAAKSAIPAAKQRASAEIEGFIDRATTALGAQQAEWLIDAAGMDVGVADALLPFCQGLSDRPGDARTVAAWAVTFAADRAMMGKALAYGRAALDAAIAGPDAVAVVQPLLAVRVSDAGLARLLAVAARDVSQWPAIAAFIQASFPTKGDDAAAVLETAHAAAAPLAAFAPFGAEAHVFLGFVQQDGPLFLRRATWLHQKVQAKQWKLNDLCQVQLDMRALPDPVVDTLLTTCAKPIAALRAVPAAYAHVIATAAAIPAPQLAAEVAWYEQWFVTHAQPVAGTAAIVATFPDVAERGKLIAWLTNATLRAALTTAKANRAAAAWGKLVECAAYATEPGGFTTLGNAIARIEGTYAAGADDLYDLLLAQKVTNVPRVIVDAATRGAPRAFVRWVIKHVPNVQSGDYFLAHRNAWHEYLATDGASLVASKTITVHRQRLTATSGSTTDWLHVFYVNFTLAAGGGVVRSELHNHVNGATNRQTSLHFKNDDQKGRELKLDLDIAADCRQAVKDMTTANHFPDGYRLS